MDVFASPGLENAAAMHEHAVDLIAKRRDERGLAMPSSDLYVYFAYGNGAFEHLIVPELAGESRLALDQALGLIAHLPADDHTVGELISGRFSASWLVTGLEPERQIEVLEEIEEEFGSFTDYERQVERACSIASGVLETHPVPMAKNLPGRIERELVRESAYARRIAADFEEALMLAATAQGEFARDYAADRAYAAAVDTVKLTAISQIREYVAEAITRERAPPRRAMVIRSPQLEASVRMLNTVWLRLYDEPFYEWKPLDHLTVEDAAALNTLKQTARESFADARGPIETAMQHEPGRIAFADARASGFEEFLGYLH